MQRITGTSESSWPPEIQTGCFFGSCVQLEHESMGSEVTERNSESGDGIQCVQQFVLVFLLVFFKKKGLKNFITYSVASSTDPVFSCGW